ncbi:hypothetical protein TgHK011_005097 [Trichoderma gracile]|nr:hypothetical protein TgHK011_005097 [Trichoderma gracile]
MLIQIQTTSGHLVIRNALTYMKRIVVYHEHVVNLQIELRFRIRGGNRSSVVIQENNSKRLVRGASEKRTELPSGISLAGDDRRRIIAATQGSLSPVFSFGRNWTEGSELDGRMTKGDETGLDCQDS